MPLGHLTWGGGTESPTLVFMTHLVIFVISEQITVVMHKCEAIRNVVDINDSHCFTRKHRHDQRHSIHRLHIYGLSFVRII